MAERGIRLIYGGGRAGVMGAVAGAVLSAGGKVTGIIPDFLLRQEVGRTNITELEVVDTMHARKARMAELSDAFLILPGGLGTLEEYFEILTWRQLRLHDKPIAVLNTDGYWDRLRDTVDGIVEANYARPENAAMTSYVDTAEQALDTLERQVSSSGYISSEEL
jgi:uncharacterized protein (TIGR00730 family)